MRNSKNIWIRLCLAAATVLALFSLAAFAAAGTVMAAAVEEAAPETAAAPAAEEPAEAAGSLAADKAPAAEADQAVPYGSGEDAAAGRAEETADASSVSDAPAETSAIAEVPSDEAAGPADQSSASPEAEESLAAAKSAPAAAESLDEDAAAGMAEETADASAESDAPAEASAGAEVPADEGTGTAAQSSASAEAEESPAAAKSAPAAAESLDEDAGAGVQEEASGILAADSPAALAPRAAAFRTTRVYLYVNLESLPKDARDNLSTNATGAWVTVGYIDVPASVLPTASPSSVGKGYIFKDLYEPRIASGNTVKYPITYYTPTYGNGKGTRVDQNSYYQQIASYIDWNFKGLLVDSGANDYSEAGQRPSWHLDGYYNYSENRLKVEKSVTGNFGDKARQYRFTASYDKPDGTSQTISFTLSDGESKLITVPSRTRITVTEDDYSGDDYDTTVTQGSSTQNSRTWSTDSLDANTTIVFVNHRAITPDVGIDLPSVPYLAILAGASVFGAFFLIRFRRAQR